MIFFYAVEDALTAILAKRILAHALGMDLVLRPLGQERGNGQLRKNLPKYCDLAQHYPVLVLTDLDRIDCPPKLVKDWFGQTIIPPKMFFRVAVREAEAWVMADRDGFARYLGLSKGKLASAPENLPDPKAALISLAGLARRDLRDMIVPESRSGALVGREYNDALGAFVAGAWNIEAASHAAPSLRRAIDRIQNFAQ